MKEELVIYVHHVRIRRTKRYLQRVSVEVLRRRKGPLIPENKEISMLGIYRYR
jgi:hypothetical protein